MDSLLEADIGQVDRSDNVGSDCSLLVVLAPIDIWTSSASSTVEDVGWLDLLNFGNDSLTVLHADSCGGDLLALLLEECLQVTSNPSFTTPDELTQSVVVVLVRGKTLTKLSFPVGAIL